MFSSTFFLIRKLSGYRFLHHEAFHFSGQFRARRDFGYLLGTVHRFTSSSNAWSHKRRNERVEEKAVIFSGKYSEFDDDEDTRSDKESFLLNKEDFTVKIEFKVPDLGKDKAFVETWYKQEGDLIQRNDVLCDISTKLFTFSMSSDDECDGIMGKIIAPADSEPLASDDILCYVWHKPEHNQNDEN